MEFLKKGNFYLGEVEEFYETSETGSKQQNLKVESLPDTQGTINKTDRRQMTSMTIAEFQIPQSLNTELGSDVIPEFKVLYIPVVKLKKSKRQGRAIQVSLEIQHSTFLFALKNAAATHP